MSYHMNLNLDHDFSFADSVFALYVLQSHVQWNQIEGKYEVSGRYFEEWATEFLDKLKDA